MQLINECLAQALACFSYPNKVAMMETMCIDEPDAMKTETPGLSSECLSEGELSGSEASSGTDYDTERHSDGDVCLEGYSSPSSSYDQSLPSDSCHSGKRKRGQNPRTCQLTPPEVEYPPGILPAHKDRFRVCLKNWTTRMAGMQPKCKFGDELYERSLVLLFRYFRRRGDHAALRSAWEIQSDLAACLWLCTKADGNRSCVPSRTLITKATDVTPHNITESELSILIALEWNLNITPFSRLPIKDRVEDPCLLSDVTSWSQQ